MSDLKHFSEPIRVLLQRSGASSGWKS